MIFLGGKFFNLHFFCEAEKSRHYIFSADTQFLAVTGNAIPVAEIITLAREIGGDGSDAFSDR